MRNVRQHFPLAMRGPALKRAQAGKLLTITGPCSAESPEQLELCAKALIKHGFEWMRAGAFKPRKSPYDFQGHGQLALSWIAGLKRSYPLKIVSEILDPRNIEEALAVIDMIQIGTRNMHNTSLLKAVSETDRPILLKRGWSSTYQEWLGAAEYLLYHGAKEVILCERGIRTFETHTRFTLDINAVAVMKELTELKIIVDPSHATGNRRWVLPAARAAIAAGADGVLIEVHPDPCNALSDAEQSLPLEALEEIAKLEELKRIIDVEYTKA